MYITNVYDRLDVHYNSKASRDRIEQCLLEKVLEDAWENMNEDQRRKVFQDLSNSAEMPSSFKSGVLIALFRSGKFASYKISLIIVNSVYKFIMGRGLSLATNAALTRGLSILVGPIGIAISALWTAIDIAGPAYRVTQPAVIYIAAMRYAKRNAR